MYQVFHQGLWIFGGNKPNEPRQQECDIYGEKWLLLKFKDDQAHKNEIILRQGQGGLRGY